jgi:hypothetical protein
MCREGTGITGNSRTALQTLFSGKHEPSSRQTVRYLFAHESHMKLSVIEPITWNRNSDRCATFFAVRICQPFMYIRPADFNKAQALVRFSNTNHNTSSNNYKERSVCIKPVQDTTGNQWQLHSSHNKQYAAKFFLISWQSPS